MLAGHGRQSKGDGPQNKSEGPTDTTGDAERERSPRVVPQVSHIEDNRPGDTPSNPECEQSSSPSSRTSECDCFHCGWRDHCSCNRANCEACIVGLHELCGKCDELGFPPEGTECPCERACCEACLYGRHCDCSVCDAPGPHPTRDLPASSAEICSRQPTRAGITVVGDSSTGQSTTEAANRVLPASSAAAWPHLPTRTDIADADRSTGHYTTGSTDRRLAGQGNQSKGDGPSAEAGTVYYGPVGSSQPTIAVLISRPSPRQVRFAVPRSPDFEGGVRVRAAEGNAWLDCQVVSRPNARGLTRTPRQGVAYRTWAPMQFQGNSPRWLPTLADLEDADRPTDMLPSQATMSVESATQDEAMPAAASTWDESLAWWDGIDYDEYLGQRVQTVDFVPSSLVTGAADARTRVLTALTQVERGSVLEGRLWKVLTFFDRLLFCARRGGRTVRRGGRRHGQSYKGQSWERTLAFRLSAFMNGDWAALWREAAPSPSEPRTAQPSPAARETVQAKRVERLVRNGEVSKAVAAVFRDSTLATGPEVFTALLKLFPEVPTEVADHITAFAAPEGLPAEFREKVEQGVRACLPRTPRCSAPGPSGSRFEHWATLSANSSGLTAAGVVLTRFLLGEAPATAIAANLSAVLYAIPKSAGGGIEDARYRPIACGSVIRRLAAKGACFALADELRTAVGPLQFAVGRPAGAEKVHKLLTALSETHPEAAFIKLDCKNAYNSTLRSAVHEGVRSRIPALATIAATLCPEETSHYWFGADDCSRRIRAVRGVDQGCPLSAALFAIAIASPLEELQAELRKVDPNAVCISYLDDIYIVIKSDEVDTAIKAVHKLFPPIGLVLNDKTEVWTPRGFTALPAGIKRVASFTCLGSAALWVPEACARVAIATPGGGLAASLDALRAFGTQLAILQGAGLSLATALTVHRAWAGGTLTHHLRANLLEPAFAAAWDDTVEHFWAAALDRPLDADRRAQLHLPGKSGGCGVASAQLMQVPAYLGSWELCLEEVASMLGANSATQFMALVPATRTTIEAAAQALRVAGVTDYSFDWEALFTDPRKRRQHELTHDLHEATHARLLRDLDEMDRIDLRSAGGTGAAAFLEPPTEDLHMPDARLRTALRARLRLCRPGFDVSLALTEPATHCHHRYADTGAFCGQTLDDEHPPPLCHVGGGWERGHNRARDWLALWVQEQTGEPTDKEQLVSAWHKRRQDGSLKLAQLDVSCSVHGQRTHVDLAFTTAASLKARHDARERAARASEDGRAASQTVRDKRIRYPPGDNPGEALVPFVLEALGRPSDEAAAFLRAVAPTDPTQRAVVLARAWQALSIITQTRLAELYISAERPRPPR